MVSNMTALNQTQLDQLLARVSQLEVTEDARAIQLDAMWLILNSCFVLMMQMGFAMLEVRAYRTPTTGAVMIIETRARVIP